ncbi:hypothetical protein EPN81_04425 [Patescibacteria group bacterium]|nr:MAG: hypothetical protein EPN81_04425 [Patescibacteria group bacterium]
MRVVHAMMLLVIFVLATACSEPGDSFNIISTDPRIGDVSGDRAARDPSGSMVTDIVVLVVDTLRADAFGCGTDADMPFTEAFFAEHGTCFARASSSAPWTTPGTVGVLSGTHPSTNRVFEYIGTSNVLSEDIWLAGELLKGYGFKSGQASANPMAWQQAGIESRFDEAANLPLPSSDDLQQENDRTILEGYADLRTKLGHKAVIHLQPMSPHSQWCPTEANTWVTAEDGKAYDICHLDPSTSDSFREAVLSGDQMLLEAVKSLYREEVSLLDIELASFLSSLDLTRTVVVFTADHGDQFMEHGRFEHGNSVFREEVRVPLAMAGPRIPKGTSVTDIPVSTVDILPTIFTVLGAELDPQFEGRSLLRLAKGTDPNGMLGRAYCENPAGNEQIHWMDQGITVSLPEGGIYTLIRKGDDGTTYLYDEVADPEQEINLAGDPSIQWIYDLLLPMLPTDFGPVQPWDEWMGAF